jgi:hypothetical protein
LKPLLAGGRIQSWPMAKYKTNANGIAKEVLDALLPYKANNAVQR